jgi:hypothetical protein
MYNDLILVCHHMKGVYIRTQTTVQYTRVAMLIPEAYGTSSSTLS